MAKHFLLLLTIYTTSAVSSSGLVEESRSSHIRDVTSRPKRDIDVDRASSEQTTVGLTTIEPLNLQSMGSAKDVENDLYRRDLPTLSLVKRTPKGFMGMRGKKDFEYSDFIPNELEGDAFWSEKRVPSGFMGMRGKKAIGSFYGVRGKKDMYDEGDVNSAYLYADPPDVDHDEDWSWESAAKRAASAGFYAMRGKKVPYGLVQGDDFEFEKRVPSGFMGMRGRRFWEDPFDGDKRSPSAFYGVRGKKDISSQLDSENGFVDSRGKKLYSGFFASRGKKEPFSFRNKFVGVRGKKSSRDALQSLESQLIDSSAVDNLLDTDKRVPAGFMGMRG